jgi:hypothetical protein
VGISDLRHTSLPDLGVKYGSSASSVPLSEDTPHRDNHKFACYPRACSYPSRQPPKSLDEMQQDKRWSENVDLRIGAAFLVSGQQVTSCKLRAAGLQPPSVSTRTDVDAAHFTAIQPFIGICRYEGSLPTNMLSGDYEVYARFRRWRFRCVVLVNFAGQKGHSLVCGSCGTFPL